MRYAMESMTVVAAFVIVGLVFAWAACFARAASATGPPTDFDYDGVPNGDDNCPCTWNPGQADIEWVHGEGVVIDGDGYGNVCDGDWMDGSAFPSPPDGLVGMPDFSALAWCLENGNTGSPYFPVDPVCFGMDMDSSGSIGTPDVVAFQRQMARGFPGELAEECNPLP